MVSPVFLTCVVLNRLLTTGYFSNMISYIRQVIFVPSVFTTGAVDFRMWMASGLSDGAMAVFSYLDLVLVLVLDLLLLELIRQWIGLDTEADRLDAG